MKDLFGQALRQVISEGMDPEAPQGKCDDYYSVSKDGDVEKMGNMTYEQAVKQAGDSSVMTREDFKALSEAKKRKPSAGLSAKKKSDVVKKAEKGEDIGKKGKGFDKVAAKAAKEYGSKEAGERVAAAALWKNIKR